MARKVADNSIKTVDGSEVYEDKILALADQYVAGLPDPDAMTAQNKAAFNGLLKYIQRYYMRFHKPRYKYIESYDELFNIYTELCYKYNKKPTILGFSVMCDISMDTLNQWKNNNTRSYLYYTLDGKKIDSISTFKMNNPGVEYRQEFNNSYSETVKKWLRECEAALYDGATEQNSIGCIFALKANYGYTETAPAPVEYSGERRTPQEIAAAHGVELVEAKKAVPLPAFVQNDERQNEGTQYVVSDGDN